MKYLNNLKIVAAFAVLLAFISCGGDDSNPDPQPTAKELTIEALAGTWTLDAAASELANTGLDGAGVSVTFTEVGFTMTGGITAYASGGTYVIDEAGSITAPVVTITSTEIMLDGTPTVVLNGTKDQITISFTTSEAAGRVDGIGTFRLVFNKG
jgi:hypothetical protein